MDDMYHLELIPITFPEQIIGSMRVRFALQEESNLTRYAVQLVTRNGRYARCHKEIDTLGFIGSSHAERFTVTVGSHNFYSIQYAPFPVIITNETHAQASYRCTWVG